MFRVTLASLFLLLPLATAHAGDGVIEINAACVASGCFPGDDPGWPVEINTGGSYRLTSNLAVPAGNDGLLVEASDVTINLGGFAITGPVTCSGTTPTCTPAVSGFGISALATDFINLTIFNGTFRGLGTGAIWSNFPNTNIHDLSLSDMGNIALNLSGLATVNNVRISRCEDIGINGNFRTSVSNSVFWNVGRMGVRNGYCRDNLFRENGDFDGSDEETCQFLIGENYCNGVFCP